MGCQFRMLQLIIELWVNYLTDVSLVYRCTNITTF